MSLEKEFANYEQSVAVRELGFDEKCIATIENNGYVHIKGTRGLPSAAAVVNKVDAPLKQQVFRWFRKKYGLNSHIHQESRNDYSYSCGYGFSRKIKGYRDFTTYEEAENACIDQLILIGKQQDNAE